MAIKRKFKPVTLNLPLEILSVRQLSKLGMTFWIGGTLSLAILIIPLLFKTLDQISAAALTGQLLNFNAYIGVVALTIALFEIVLNYRLLIFKLRKFWYVLAMEAILIINYLALFPIIARLRGRLADIAQHVISLNSSFNFWHSISAALFTLTCILGVLYIFEK